MPKGYSSELELIDRSDQLVPTDRDADYARPVLLASFERSTTHQRTPHPLYLLEHGAPGHSLQTRAGGIRATGQ